MAEYWSNGMATLYQADARAIPLPDKSVHMCVTSPPYWGLRSYDLGDTGIGLEPTLGEWVANIVAVMREVRRVLRDDGTVWLNLGDAYCNTNPRGHFGDQGDLSTGSHGENIKRNLTGLPGPKNLMGQPWRVAFALQDDGWILRSAIVWHKPNPMPESVRDRPTNAYEMLFLLAKQGRYFYDAEALRQPRVPHSPTLGFRPMQGGSPYKNQKGAQGNSIYNPDAGEYVMPAEEQIGGTANARNVWSIPTQGRPDAHFATYPDELPRRCILAGTSERGVCTDCGAPWVRVVEHKTAGGPTVGTGQNGDRKDAGMGGFYGASTQTLGWQPTCDCNAATVPATVLDPFAGSGTTLAVAQALGRKSVGLDLNPEYLEIAQRYINRADGITLSLGL